MEKVHFLGHVIFKEGVSIYPAKVETTVNWPKPTNSTEVRSFVKMVSYYRRFVKEFSKLALPLTLSLIHI